MPFAVTHILSTILLLDIYRKFSKHKKNFPLSFIYIAGIFSIIPDTDFILYWIINGFTNFNLVHKVYSHTILMPIIILVFASFMFNINKMWGRLTVLCSFAYLNHIFLDYIFSWPHTYLWPFSMKVYSFNIIPTIFKDWFWWAGLDTAFLILWLLWELKHDRIKDFI